MDVSLPTLNFGGFHLRDNKPIEFLLTLGVWSVDDVDWGKANGRSWKRVVLRLRWWLFNSGYKDGNDNVMSEFDGNTLGHRNSGT